MASYLPKDSNAGSAYQEGGGLYALGKILADFTFTDHYHNLYTCFLCTRNKLFRPKKN